jgi:hypothetical protein
MYREFVALVEPLDDIGNALIKQLENPRHDEISAERIPDAEKRRAAAKIMGGLGKLIRDTLKKAALPEPAERESLNELAEFFADRKPNETPAQPGGEENPERRKYTVTPGRRPVRPPDSGPVSGESGGAGGAKGKSEGGKGGAGGGGGSGTRGTGSSGGGNSVVLQDLRNILIGAPDSPLRRVHFTPMKSTTAAITVCASGFDSRAPLRISSSSAGSLSRGVLVLDLRAGERVTLDMGFSEDYRGPVELFAVAVDPE